MGNNIDRRSVHPPMFISARLMAAAKLADGSVLHLEWSGKTDSAGRAGVHYVIEDGEGIVLADSADLHVRGGYADALETLCSFLGAAAESYRGVGLDRARLAESENGELFPPECTEWAYQNEDEISMLAGELREGIEARA